jgi:hypothetical protein
LCPKRRASSWASMITLMAFSVKRSNMALFQYPATLLVPKILTQPKWRIVIYEQSSEVAITEPAFLHCCECLDPSKLP